MIESPENVFDIFRKAYPGSKRGLRIEWEEFIYSCRKNSKHSRVDYRDEIDKLLPALKAEIADKKSLRGCDKFCPPWKDLPTWLHQRCWTRDIPEKPKPKPVAKKEPVVPCTQAEMKEILSKAPWK